MKKGFTFIELLVVIAIGAIMAALLIPALSQAHAAAAGATCQDNVHKVGLAISTWRNDHDGAWFVIPDSPGDAHWSDQRQACQVVAFVMESYLDDLNTLVCPNLNSPHPRKPEFRMREDHNLDVSKCHYPKYPQNTDWSGAAGFCFFYDEYRIAPNSKPGRVILADGIEMCTQYGVEPPNHYDGANVL